MNDLVYIKDVVTLELDVTKCTGCGLCAIVCPHRVFRMEGRKASITDIDKCMECGACAINCRDQAISVNQGVGCAAAIMTGYFKKSEPTCGCNASCN